MIPHKPFYHHDHHQSDRELFNLKQETTKSKEATEKLRQELKAEKLNHEKVIKELHESYQGQINELRRQIEMFKTLKISVSVGELDRSKEKFKGRGTMR